MRGAEERPQHTNHEKGKASMRNIVHECPEAVHKSIDEVRDGVFERLFGKKVEPAVDYKSGFTCPEAGTRDHAGYKNRLDGNNLQHFGYHECHIRVKSEGDNSRFRRMPFKVNV